MTSWERPYNVALTPCAGITWHNRTGYALQNSLNKLIENIFNLLSAMSSIVDMSLWSLQTAVTPNTMKLTFPCKMVYNALQIGWSREKSRSKLKFSKNVLALKKVIRIYLPILYIYFITGNPTCPDNCDSAKKEDVCGSDGVTYANLCELHRKSCSDRTIKFKHYGKCGK